MKAFPNVFSIPAGYNVSKLVIMESNAEVTPTKKLVYLELDFRFIFFTFYLFKSPHTQIYVFTLLVEFYKYF